MTYERFAVVGSGSAGRRYLRLLREVRPSAELVLVSSGLGGRDDVPSEATTTVVSVHEAVQLGLTAAIVASPAPRHVEQALVLIASGCPTLVEKPIAADSSESEVLIAAASGSGTVVGVAYTLRFDLAAQHFRSLLVDRGVGTLLQARIECGSYLPDWRIGVDYHSTVSARADLGGGVLLELSHEIDYCRWFFGEVDHVQGSLSNSGDLAIDVEEAAHVLLRMRSGLAIVLIIDFHRRVARREVVVQATSGEYQWDALSNRVASTLVGGKMDVRSFTQNRDDIFRRQLVDFLRRAKLGLQPVVGVGDAFETLRTVDAIRLSGLSGQRVYV